MIRTRSKGSREETKVYLAIRELASMGGCGRRHGAEVRLLTYLCDEGERQEELGLSPNVPVSR